MTTTVTSNFIPSATSVTLRGPTKSTHNLSRFIGVDDGVAQDFLTDNPSLEAELDRAVPIIEGIFGRDVQLALKISENPDDPSVKTAICYVHTTADIEAAESKLEALYQAQHGEPRDLSNADRMETAGQLLFDVYLD